MSGVTAGSGQAALIDRLRALLADDPPAREVSMFGGRSFMVHDRLLVSAMKDGDLLVRVDPDRHDELLRLPGASQAEMGAGRTMGPGWISVAAGTLTDERLSFWVGTAMEHHRA